MNWDVLADRGDILAGRLPPGQTRVILTKFTSTHSGAI